MEECEVFWCWALTRCVDSGTSCKGYLGTYKFCDSSRLSTNMFEDCDTECSRKNAIRATSDSILGDGLLKNSAVVSSAKQWS